MILKKRCITNIRQLFILGIALLSFQSLQAQVSFCGTPNTTSNSAVNTAIAASANSSSSSGFSNPWTLRVYYHVIRRTNGTGGYLPNEVQQTFDILQGDYNPHGVLFAWDGCINYIDSDSRFNNGVNNSIYGVDNHSDGIDIYLFPASNPSAGGRANGVGSSSEFWVAGTWGGTPVPFTRIISHEMGHVLFLWHTHHGCENGSWENTDGSNCAWAGDLVCDTPADPHMSFNVDANCNWTGIAHPFCSGQAPEPLSDYNPDENNLMAYTDPPCMQYISAGQGQRAWFAIQQLQYLQDCVVAPGTVVIDQCSCPAEDITIDQDLVIDTDLVVTGDLNIINGATVTVTATIFMTTSHGINVFETSKLIVDGGTLTSCDATWRGVKAAGGNTDFDVRIINGSLVENTSEAAVSMDPPYPSPQNQLHGNGILLAQSSTFNNCNSLAEFMSWSALPNISSIINCRQDDGVLGVTNENCQGILVRRTVFTNISQNCIVSTGGSYSLISNVFNSGSHDVLYNNLSAGIGSLVERNRFNGNTFGYRARGTTFAQNEIVNNTFTTGLADVYNDGANSFKVWKNIITARYGVVSGNNGAGIGDVHNNRFAGNSTSGIYTFGNNPDFNFFLNCFNTTSRDVTIFGQVSPLVHHNISAANNCFTHGGNIGSPVPDITGSPSPFNYLEPLDKPLDCRDVLFAPPAVSVIQFGSPVSALCGPGIFQVEVKDPCEPVRNLVAVSNAYAQLEKEYAEVKGSTREDGTKDLALEATLLDCLTKLKGLLAELNIQKGEYSEARKLYDEDKTEDAQVLVYSTYLLENDLKSAQQYLSRIDARSEAMRDFIEIQNIVLRRAPLGRNYKSDASEIAKVEELASQTHRYAAYGKSLYYVLTGETLKVEFPEFETPKVDKRSIEQVDEKVKVYPNPFIDNLTIELKGYEKANVEITDIAGKKMYAASLSSGVNRIDSNGWTHGIYFVVLTSEDKVVYQDKIILLE